MSLSARRAWIEISALGGKTVVVWSLSARRAWIEIIQMVLMIQLWLVALRKESVDRNGISLQLSVPSDQSLSARRAWIEILNG